MKLVLRIIFIYCMLVALWGVGDFFGHERVAFLLLVVAGLISLGYLAAKRPNA